MKTVTITQAIEGNTYTAEFHSAQDCGYKYSGLLLDLPCGDTISIRKIGSKWVETRIINGIGRISSSHATRQAAIESAAEEYFGLAHYAEVIK